MKLQELLLEVPAMADQEHYPYTDKSQGVIDNAGSLDDIPLVWEQDNIQIRSRDQHRLYLVYDGKSVGIMELTPAHHNPTTVKAWQVFNVFITPEYRNKGLGLVLYNYILHDRKEAFASGAAMTPSSRRVYGSLLKDDTVDVYAWYKDKRYDLHIGKDGITTGDNAIDHRSTFIMVAQ